MLPGVIVKKKEVFVYKAYTMSSINASDFFFIQVLFFSNTHNQIPGTDTRKKKSDISESWSHLMCQIPDSSWVEM